DEPAPDALELPADAGLEAGRAGAGEAAAIEPPPAPDMLEATTVVPPSVRLVERSAEGQAAIDKLMQQLDENVDEIESIPLATSAPPAAAIPPPVPSAAAPKGREPEGGWELELESLNQKSGEHEIV